METNTTFQSSWTLAEALIFDIAAHLKAAREAWLRGDLEKYYWEMECVIRILKGLLEDKEKDEAKRQETAIIKNIPMDNLEKKKALCVLLKDYDEFVMTCLHKHKLDVPPKKDRTRLVG